MSFNLLVLCFLTASQDSCQGKGHCRTSLNFSPTSLLLVVLHESISCIKMQVQFFGFRGRRTEQKLKFCSLNGANERKDASRNSFNSQFLKDTVCIQRNFFSFQFQFQVKPNWFANINFFLQLRLSSSDGLTYLPLLITSKSESDWEVVNGWTSNSKTECSLWNSGSLVCLSVTWTWPFL